jgi:hypothetical protein
VGLVVFYYFLGLFVKFLWMMFPSLICFGVGNMIFFAVKGWTGIFFYIIGVLVSFALYFSWKESTVYTKGEDLLCDIFG